EKFMAVIRTRQNSPEVYDPDSHKNQVNQLFNHIQAALNENDNNYGNVLQALSENMTGSAYTPLLTHRNALFQYYEDFYAKHQKLVDEEKMINRIERNAYIRATFFRTLTTALIAGVIFLFYYIAHQIGMQMPMQFGKAQQSTQQMTISEKTLQVEKGAVEKEKKIEIKLPKQANQPTEKGDVE
ncbi:MAG: hypothetical protein IH811_07320, partial [Proteobacteria bacterium]|nr:hypothetical protein [Pseudomonadota bacterium]